MGSNAAHAEKDHLWMGTDMVDSCQEKKPNLIAFLSAVLDVDFFQDTQRGGTFIATVDRSDIRGLVTA